MPSIDISNLKKTRPKPAAGPNFVQKLGAVMEKDIRLGGSGLSDEKKEYLYLELGALLKAGVDFKSAFELVVAGQKKPADIKLLSDVLQDVLTGAALSQALKRTGRFSLYEVYSLEIGEETGKMLEVLADLAYYFRTKSIQRRTIIGALTYPAIVMSAAFAALYFMMRFMVPMFSDIFRRSGAELPWITRQMIAVSEAFGTYGGPLLLVILIGVALCFYWRHREWFRRFTAQAVLRVPVAGDLVRKIYLARLSNAMRLLINARLPLLRAISLCRQMIGYYPLEHSLEVIEADILRGKPLHESMSAFSIYPPKMVQLLKVGEHTNQLDQFFDWVARQYIAEAEHQTATLNRVLQPVIIMLLGVVVGLIVISMYLPLFQMSNSIG